MENQAFWYKEYKQGRRFFIKIVPGQKIVEALKQFVKMEGVKSAVVLSAIGSVHNIRMNDIKSGARLPITPARLVVHEIEGPLELLALTGNLIPIDNHRENEPSCHLHITASKSSGDVIGGHMAEAEVFATCEIVLVELLVEGLARQHSQSGGTDTVFFDRGDETHG